MNNPKCDFCSVGEAYKPYPYDSLQVAACKVCGDLIDKARLSERRHCRARCWRELRNRSPKQEKFTDNRKCLETIARLKGDRFHASFRKFMEEAWK